MPRVWGTVSRKIRRKTRYIWKIYLTNTYDQKIFLKYHNITPVFCRATVMYLYILTQDLFRLGNTWLVRDMLDSTMDVFEKTALSPKNLKWLCWTRVKRFFMSYALCPKNRGIYKSEVDIYLATKCPVPAQEGEVWLWAEEGKLVSTAQEGAEGGRLLFLGQSTNLESCVHADCKVGLFRGLK